MYPDKEQAARLLAEAEQCNPGKWGDHSRHVALCAEKIAALCPGMDPEKAYVLGLLHDIGRKFGVRHMGHVYDGWKYMLSLGYEDAARICLTHSFSIQDINVYVGNVDITKKEHAELRSALSQITYDDYDRLIQLCDSIAMAEGPSTLEERMGDVKIRYGRYPQEKWDKNMSLKTYFEEKMGRDLYEVCLTSHPH